MQIAAIETAIKMDSALVLGGDESRFDTRLRDNGIFQIPREALVVVQAQRWLVKGSH